MSRGQVLKCSLNLPTKGVDQLSSWDVDDGDGDILDNTNSLWFDDTLDGDYNDSILMIDSWWRCQRWSMFDDQWLMKVMMLMVVMMDMKVFWCYALMLCAFDDNDDAPQWWWWWLCSIWPKCDDNDDDDDGSDDGSDAGSDDDDDDDDDDDGSDHGSDSDGDDGDRKRMIICVIWLYLRCLHGDGDAAMIDDWCPVVDDSDNADGDDANDDYQN